jgi:parallel beta-helix repeat protein
MEVNPKIMGKGVKEMNNSRGYLDICLLLVLIVSLLTPWQLVRASWFESPLDGHPYGVFDDLLKLKSPQPYRLAVQSLVASSVAHGDQGEGAHIWRSTKVQPISRLARPTSMETAVHPDRPAGTCTVSSTSDSGTNTLRQCLLDAVAGDEILFDPTTFPPGSPATISLASDLPWILVNDLTIDASDAGVILDGSALPSGSLGLVLGSVSGVNLRGLQILGFTRGVVIGFGAANNTIGGDREIGAGPLGQGNLVSGNENTGIQLQDEGTDNNSIIGNFIGTDLTGSSADGNEVAGIIVGWGAAQNVIGGVRSPGACDGPCNLISGNVDLGLAILHSGTTDNQVLGNFIGTNINGDTALHNNQGVVLGLDATNSQVGGIGAGEGNLISGNTNFGIWISSAGTTGSQLLGNIIGADISGTYALPNYFGIIISESTGTQVGGAGTGAGNLISGNEYAGIRMEYVGMPGNTIAGNKLGTNLSGTGALPNNYGVILVEASNNTIGGMEPGAGNLISGNAQQGLNIGSDSNLNSVLGNSIGTDLTGEVALPNVVYGVFIGFASSDNTIGSSALGGGNLISGNGQAGIFIQNETSVGNQILGNRIGTNGAGSSALPNFNGVTVVLARETIIGGADTNTPWLCDGPCNLISGNNQFGVTIQGVSAEEPGWTRQDETVRSLLADQNNQVLGNFIGTDLNGTSAVPNLAGLDLSYEAMTNLVGGSNQLGEGNLISGNNREGIVVRHPLTSNNQIAGNRIGTTANGEVALANGGYGIWIYASGNTVGGDGPGMGNQISGQAMDLGYYGVLIGTETKAEAMDNQVIGNLIGSNKAGTGAIPNGGGVALAWEATGSVIRDNVISGNANHGILIYSATDNEVSDNGIGVAKDGQSPLANAGVGIILDTAPQNQVGPGNTIAYNAVGVAIGYPESVGNTITQNSIYGNTEDQIDFFEVPQPLSPAPILSAWDGSTVSGTACAGCQVEVFNNWLPGPAGFAYLGTTTAAGDGSFSLSPPTPPPGQEYRYLTATATDGEGTTSEFSDSLFIGTYSYIYLPMTAKNAGP